MIYQRKTSRLLLVGLILSMAALLVSCSSRSRTAQFYSLSQNKASSVELPLNKNIVLGLKKIAMPEYLDRPNLVSFNGANTLKVSKYHMWAGNLHAKLARVIKQDLQNYWGVDVWTAPWDNRIRPDYHIDIIFNELYGVKGQQFFLASQWQIRDEKGIKILLKGEENITLPIVSESYEGYVKAFNLAISGMTESMAKKIQNFMIN